MLARGTGALGNIDDGGRRIEGDGNDKDDFPLYKSCREILDNINKIIDNLISFKKIIGKFLF